MSENDTCIDLINIEEAYKNDKLETVKRIANAYPDIIEFQIFLIKGYRNKNMYYDAINLAEKFNDDAKVASLLVSLYLKVSRNRNKRVEYMDKALKLSEHYIKQESISEHDLQIFISQVINIYLKQDKLDEALNIGEPYIEVNNYIRSQMITAYIKKGNGKKAEELGLFHLSHITIALQLMKYYCDCGRLFESELIVEIIDFNDLSEFNKKRIMEQLKEVEKKRKNLIDANKRDVVTGDIFRYSILNQIINKSIDIASLSYLLKKVSNLERVVYYCAALKQDLITDNNFRKELLELKKNSDKKSLEHEISIILYSLLMTKKTTIDHIGLYEDLLRKVKEDKSLDKVKVVEK